MFDVAPAVANMSADSESWWSFSAVSPLVEGGDGYAEVFGEFLDGEELVPLSHAVDHVGDPVGSVSSLVVTRVTGFSTGL